MRKLRFNTQGSILKGMKESPPLKKVVVWDKLVYMAALASLVVSVSYYFLYKKLYVYAKAEIVIDNYLVAFPNEVQITELLAKEGDTVTKGDTLFMQRSEFKSNTPVAFAHLEQKQPEEKWYRKELITTEKNLQLKEIDWLSAKQKVNALTRELQTVKEKVILDIVPASRIAEYDRHLSEAHADLQKLIEEKNYLKRYLTVLERTSRTDQQAAVRFASLNPEPVDNGVQPFTSPMNGIIKEIYKKENAVTYRGEYIMQIVNDMAPPVIKAHIRQRDIKFCSVGKVVDLEFIDGTVSQGRISFISTTLDPVQPNEKVELDRHHQLTAQLVPVNAEEREKWRKAYGVGVEMKMSKFF
jgi:multidrug resistance efflux pump